MRKRILSMLLALCMAVSVMPVAAFATQGIPPIGTSNVTDSHTHDETCDPVEEGAGAHTNKDGQPVAAACVCTAQCTLADQQNGVEESINSNCPICAAEGMHLSSCKGISGLTFAVIPSEITASAAWNNGDTIDYPVTIKGGTEAAPIVITVNGTVTVNQQITITDGSHVRFTGIGTLQSGTLANHLSVIAVKKGSFLTMDSITINGTGTETNNGGGVSVHMSTFTMNSGSITNSGGSGVDVGYQSTVTMNGGDITGNKAESGGGVYVVQEGTFIMNGGNITGNTADKGTSTSPDSKGNGGGVYVDYKGTFTMTGGSITNNTATTGTGGGVYVSSNGTFTMTGGSITNSGGSGVSVFGTFIMNGGDIAGNKGSGVSVSGTFTMTAGSITGNTATSGGGVYVNGTFTMTGGSITNNTATTGDGDGGGVFSFAPINVSGTACITDNVKKNEQGIITSNNIYLFRETASVNVTGALTGSIGVSLSEQWNLTAGTSKDIAVGKNYTLTTDDMQHLVSDVIYQPSGTDNISYTTSLDTTNNKIQITATTATNIKIVDGTTGHYATLAAAITAAADGDIIDLQINETLSAEQSITKNVTLTSTKGNSILRDSGYTGVLLTVGNDTSTNTVTLNGMTLNGNQVANTNSAVRVKSGATLIMNAGSSITGNTASSGGGGVYVESTGTLTMNSGSITNNTATTGGGVYVESTGTLTMNGGSITNNRAGNGGGVTAASGGALTMNGGDITGNTAGDSGGGVYVSATFTMNAGRITGNTASSNGGGVYVSSATLTMNGGSITGNTASSNGGGVYVNSVTLTMNGGDITGNKASNGGGVYVNSGTLTMNGGDITNNTASSNGGGVRVATNATFTMDGGRITGNTASSGPQLASKSGTLKTTVLKAEDIPNIPDKAYTGSPININPTVNSTRTMLGYSFTVVSTGYDAPKFQKKDTSGWVDVAEVKEVGNYKIVYTKTSAPIVKVEKPFNIVKSTTSFDGGVKTYNGSTEATTFTYGETITVKAKPTAAVTFTAPAANQMALYKGTTQISDAVNAGTDGVYTMTYNTANKNLVIGENTIIAKYVGNDNMTDAEGSVSVTLNKKPLTATVQASTTKVYDGTNDFTKVSLAFGTGEILSGDTVTATANGTSAGVNAASHAFTATSVALSGTQAGYYDLTVSGVSGTVTISQKPLASGMIGTISAQTYTGSAIKPKLTVTDGSPSILTAGDYTVSYTGNTNAGTATASITATAIGNYSGTAGKTFEIKKAAPTVTVTAQKKGTRASIGNYGDTVTLTATVSGVNGAQPTGTVQFKENSKAVGTAITVTNGTASYDWTNASVGTHSITAEFTAGTTGVGKNYSNKTSAAYAFSLDKADQTGFAITPVTGKKYLDAPFTLSTTGGNDNGAVSYSVPAGNGVLTVNGSTATIVGAGTVTVTATKAASTNYNSATATLNVTIAKAAAPVVQFPSAAGLTYGKKLSDSVLTGGDTTYGTFAWENDAIVPTVTNSGYIVKFTANADTVKNYETITTTTHTVSVAVTKSTPNVDIKAAVSSESGSRKVVLTATVGKVGFGDIPTGTVKFVDVTSGSDVEISGATAVSLANGVATYTWTGFADQAYTIKAVYNGDSNYGLATSSGVSVDTTRKNQQNFAMSAIGAKTYGDSTFQLSTTGGSGTGAITFKSSDENVIKIDGATATILKAGTAKITATKAGDNEYNEAVSEESVTVAKKNITVTAEDKTVSKGEVMPTFSYKADTLVTGDSFTIAPTLSTTVTDTNTVGEYTIAISGGTLKNADSYNISYVNGKLKVVNQLYTITVTGGTADKTEAAAGETVTITANTPQSGKQFKEWTATGITLADKTQNPVTITMPAGAVTLTAVYETIPAVTAYAISFDANGGTVSPTTATTTEGKLTSLPTPTRSNHRFDGWFTAASGGTAVTTSTVFSKDSTIYARWTYTGGGGGSSSGGGNNDNSNITVTTPPADKPNTPTEGNIKVDGKVDGNGNANVSITDKNINDAFDKALADAKKNGNEANGITLVLNVNAGNKTANSLTVNLPKTVQDTIISKKIVNTVVVVDHPDIKINMDLSTVKEINTQAKSDVNITATKQDNGKLTGNAKTAIGSRPVFDLKVNYGNNKQVSNFGAGSVAVEIPYILGANEKASNIYAVYVDANGKVQWLTSSVYDSVNKVLRFTTSHFSTYGIGYKETNASFTDITNHWAKDAISFVVACGLFSGTSNTTFSPDIAMTRGMFVTALGRLANADVSEYKTSSFSDVTAEAYYMGYVEWASKNGIVNGIGDGKFAPDQSITREQMAVIMANYAKVIGFDLPKVYAENTFADGANISTWAKDAVKAMQIAGVINGKDGNRFDPQGTATRAEVSAVLKRFVELARSSDTAQGWAMNDSGKWMYYENGKALTGKQTIGGVSYTFNSYGETNDTPRGLSYGTHTVVKNESWWSIAKDYKCSIFELARINNKSIFSMLYVGDVLKVPESK